MYVCICNAVTERQIRLAVDEGATTLASLSARLGVATGCGKCARMAREIIDARESERAATHAADAERVA
jgi:bacterioferritin-associated ferredoxin